jgi:hypothetical protein
MSESEVHDWLQHANLNERNDKYKVNIPSVEELCKNMQSTEKTDVINLSLSLEDNSTLTGTASILDDFAKEFCIPHGKANDYIEFDKTNKIFDLKSARERYYFMKCLQLHHVQMTELEKLLGTSEKEIDLSDLVTDVVDSESDEEESDGDSQDSSVSESSSIQKDADEKFNTFYKKIVNLAKQTVESVDDSTLDKIVQDLSKKHKELNNTRDRFGRTVFHAAIEEKRYTLANILLSSGINPNVKEGCGATPLSIAVLNSDMNMCKLLVANFAEYESDMFGSFPCPRDMAVAMEANDILNFFNTSSQNSECPVVTLIQNDIYGLHTAAKSSDDRTNDCDSSSISSEFTYKRSQCDKFPTAVVGDVGTCKNNRGLRNRNIATYGWSTEIPGDMHAKGYLCEAAFKAHGNGGLHKVLNVIMKRPKLTKEVFKKRKFQDNNLNRIKEGVRDASESYGMAAIAAFQCSASFPSSGELKKTLQKFGSHNDILLQRFKEYLKASAEEDESHHITSSCSLCLGRF